MRGTVAIGLAACILAVSVAAAAAEEATPVSKGKELFLASKCNSCHTIAAQSVEKAAKPTEAAKPAEAPASTDAAKPAGTAPAADAKAAAPPAEGTTTARKPPDLSAVGVDLNAEFIVKYLQKLETIKDKKHMKKFAGTEEELQELAAWLGSQKDVEAAAKINSPKKEEGK